jgi:hypothetical protein
MSALFLLALAAGQPEPSNFAYLMRGAPGDSILLWRNAINRDRIIWELKAEKAQTIVLVWDGESLLKPLMACFNR